MREEEFCSSSLSNYADFPQWNQHLGIFSKAYNPYCKVYKLISNMMNILEYYSPPIVVELVL
jgi:hypothetical protein